MKRKGLKIAHVIFKFGVGGAQTLLVDILNEQSKSNSVSLIIVNDKADLNLLRELSPRIKIHMINRPRGSRNIIYLFRLNMNFIRNCYDAIHFHNENIILYILPLFDSKSFLTVHDVNINIQKPLRFKTIFAISKIVQSDLKQRLNIESSVVYNGINPNHIAKRVLNNFKQIFKIVVVSRLVHEKKGQDILLNAIKRIKSKINFDLTIDFIGDGESRSYLLNMTKEYNLDDCVHFLGMLDRSHIYKILKDYNLLVQPSRFEGFGLTVLEAMAAKVPVLASNIDGPAELLEDGKFGYLFKVGDEEDLANKLLEIVENYNSSQQKALIDNAYNRAVNDFDIVKTAEKYCHLYN